MADIVDYRNETTIQTSFDVEHALTNSMEGIDRVDIVQRVGVDPENIESMLSVTAGYLYVLARSGILWDIALGILGYLRDS